MKWTAKVTVMVEVVSGVCQPRSFSRDFEGSSFAEVFGYTADFMFECRNTPHGQCFPHSFVLDPMMNTGVDGFTVQYEQV